MVVSVTTPLSLARLGLLAIMVKLATGSSLLGMSGVRDSAIKDVKLTPLINSNFANYLYAMLPCGTMLPGGCLLCVCKCRDEKKRWA